MRCLGWFEVYLRSIAQPLRTPWCDHQTNPVPSSKESVPRRSAKEAASCSSSHMVLKPRGRTRRLSSCGAHETCSSQGGQGRRWSLSQRLGRGSHRLAAKKRMRCVQQQWYTVHTSPPAIANCFPGASGIIFGPFTRTKYSFFQVFESQDYIFLVVFLFFFSLEMVQQYNKNLLLTPLPARAVPCSPLRSTRCLVCKCIVLFRMATLLAI